MLTTEWNIDDEIAVKVRSEREKIARALLSKGTMSVAEIAETTGLDQNEVFKLMGLIQ